MDSSVAHGGDFEVDEFADEIVAMADTLRQA